MINIIMVLLGSIVAVSVVGFILWLFYLAVDSWFQPQHQGMARVIEKSFTPAYTTITYTRLGNIMVPITNFIANTWTLYLSADNRTGSMDVTKEFYNSVKRGRELRIRYKCGRISKRLYVTDIL